MRTSRLLVVNPVNLDLSSMEMENVSKQLLPLLLHSGHAHGSDRLAKRMYISNDSMIYNLNLSVIAMCIIHRDR